MQTRRVMPWLQFRENIHSYTYATLSSVYYRTSYCCMAQNGTVAEMPPRLFNELLDAHIAVNVCTHLRLHCRIFMREAAAEEWKKSFQNA